MQPYPNPTREQQATIDRNAAMEPHDAGISDWRQWERLLFYRWLALAGRISG